MAGRVERLLRLEIISQADDSTTAVIAAAQKRHTAVLCELLRAHNGEESRLSKAGLSCLVIGGSSTHEEPGLVTSSILV